MKRKFKRFLQKIIGNKRVVFSITLTVVFVILVIVLNIKGVLKDHDLDNVDLNLAKTPKKQVFLTTDIKIPQASFSGQILYTDKQKLALLNPNNLQSQILAEHKNIAAPGVLRDGSVYFFSTEPDQDKQIYNHLFLQTKTGVLEYKLPLIGGDNNDQPPIVSPDAKRVFFTSKRQDKIHSQLFVYNLSDGSLTNIIKTANINIEYAHLNNKGDYLGIVYHFDGQKKSAIGVIATSSYTPNLYPKIFTDSKRLSFSDDSKYLFYLYKGNAEVKPLFENKKISASKFTWENANDLYLFKTSSLPAKNLKDWQKCENLDGWGEIQVIRFDQQKDKFTKPLSSKIQRTLLKLSNGQNIATQDRIIVNTLSTDCQQSYGILDFRNDKLQNLPFNGDIDFYWAH